MFCPKCGNQNSEVTNYCRKCGAEVEDALLAHVKQSTMEKKGTVKNQTISRPQDPDELTAAGIANVIIGDGFFMVAVLLSAIESSVSSQLWLLLLIPAFIFFGRGFADVLHSRQLRRREKQDEIEGLAKRGELQPPRSAIIEATKSRRSGELIALPSVTEGTTRDLR
jgi:hypothetical protein